MANHKLVVVDDSPSVLAVLKSALEGRGFQVLTADDGDRAIALILRERPDLIISDIQMPNLDGFLLCQIVRSRPETRDIPFIFLTTFGAPAKRVHGLKIGADDFVSKPFEMEELILRVENVLKRTGRATDPIRRKGEPKTLSGKLSELALPDILQILGLSGRSAEIALFREGEEGRILVKGGKVVGATLGSAMGRKAFFRFFRWRDAEFRLAYSDFDTATANMGDEIERVAMEGVVSLHEENALLEKLGGLDVELEPPSGREALEATLDPEARYVLGLAQKLRSLQSVIDLSRLTDLATLRHVARLAGLGMLEIRPPGPAPQA